MGYSRDGRQWSSVLGRWGWVVLCLSYVNLNRDGETRVFPANYDATSVVTQYLERLLEARYLRISPVRWHSSIGLRLDVQGCYKPYAPSLPAQETLPGPAKGQKPLPNPTNSSCASCPGLASTPSPCSCPAGALHDGVRCVAPQECPCYVGPTRSGQLPSIIPPLPSYAKAQVFSSPDCEDCLCLGAGQVLSHQSLTQHFTTCRRPALPWSVLLVPGNSTARYRPPAGKTQFLSVLSSLVRCICKECTVTEKLCAGSGECLALALWCDGVEHCGEDELHCPLPTSATTTTTTVFPERWVQVHNSI